MKITSKLVLVILAFYVSSCAQIENATSKWKTPTSEVAPATAPATETKAAEPVKAAPVKKTKKKKSSAK